MGVETAVRDNRIEMAWTSNACRVEVRGPWAEGCKIATWWKKRKGDEDEGLGTKRPFHGRMSSGKRRFSGPLEVKLPISRHAASGPGL